MFFVHIAVPFSVSTGRRVCADTASPLWRGPPAKRGLAVALCRYGCRRRGPPTPGPACRQRGGLFIGGTDRSCPTAPPRPIRAFPCVVLFPVPSVLRRPPCPTLSVLSFGLSRPGERLPAVPFVLALPPRPARSVLRRASLFRRYRLFSGARRARPISAFVRSPFGGRWPSRISIVVRSKFAQRSKSW